MMQELPAGGAMVAIQATPDEVEPLIADPAARVGLAAVNGPASVVVAGPQDAVRAVADAFAARGRKTTRLRVSHAFHSPLMDPMLAEFGALEAQLTHAPLEIALVANETGRTVDAIAPGHWSRHVRQPVRFAESVRRLRDQGVTRFLEVGPGACSPPWSSTASTTWTPPTPPVAGRSPCRCCAPDATRRIRHGRRWPASSSRAWTSTGPPWSAGPARTWSCPPIRSSVGGTG